MTGTPDASTREAASGSYQTLNSAVGVMLPSTRAPPPIMTIRPSSAATPGDAARSAATFVSGPSAMSVTGSADSSTTSRTSSTAVRRSAPRGAGSSRIPPRPSVPWMLSAGSESRRTSGWSAPAPTGTSSRPSRCRSRSAFSVVRSRPAFPPTVVTARTSSSGPDSASISAIASSIPGSVSITTGSPVAPIAQAPRARRNRSWNSAVSRVSTILITPGSRGSVGIGSKPRRSATS